MKSKLYYYDFSKRITYAISLQVIIITFTCCFTANKIGNNQSNKLLSLDEIQIYKKFIYIERSRRNASWKDWNMHLYLSSKTKYFQLNYSNSKCLQPFKFQIKQYNTIKSFSPNMFTKNIDIHVVSPGHTINFQNNNALIYFSTIIFNKNHRRAAFNYWFYCGNTCAHSGTIIFKYSGTSWRIARGGCLSYIASLEQRKFDPLPLNRTKLSMVSALLERSLLSNSPSTCHQTPHGISHFLIAFGAEKQGKSRVKGS